MPQQSFRKGNSSTMAQQCKLAGHMTAMLQIWEYLSFVMRQSVHEQCFKIGKSLAL